MKMKTTFNYILCILATIWVNKPIVMALSTDTPIIFVHGLNSNPGVWNKAESFFRARGYKNIYKFDYSLTTFIHIQVNADWLGEYISRHGLMDDEIILIAHSLGGLVSRRMAADNPQLKVAKLITLATPNYGAKYAGYCFFPGTCPDAIRDMRPGSGFLSRLNKETVYTYTEDSILTYAIDNDETVGSGSAYIATAFYLVTNHDSYLASSTDMENRLQNNISDTCVINGTHSAVRRTGGAIFGDLCIVNGTVCENNGMICMINGTLGALKNSTCELDGTQCMINTFGNGDIHGSIMNKQEVLNNVLRFIRGEVKIIEGGPRLRNPDCAYFMWDRSTIRWDVPSGSPSSLLMNLLENRNSLNVNFDNAPAEKKIREYLSKRTYKFRFFDPQTTTVTRWSSVRFADRFFRCDGHITNHANIVGSWPN